MSKSSDIRDWLRETQGREMPANGRLKAADIRAYEDAHRPPEDDVTYPGDGEPVSDSEATAEQAPRTTRRSSRSAASGWLGARRKAKGGKAKERKVFPRVSVTGLIEHSYSEMAWAAQGIPPLSRLLEAQAPVAGVVFEEVVKDTAVDRLLQPAARLEASLDATYGMLAPPFYVMAVMQTAPAPGQEPALAHKAALSGLRHSLLVMSRVSSSSLEQVIERAEENQQRSQDVEKFMRYLFGIPDPDEAQAEQPGPGPEVFASAGIGAAVPAE